MRRRLVGADDAVRRQILFRGREQRGREGGFEQSSAAHDFVPIYQQYTEPGHWFVHFEPDTLIPHGCSRRRATGVADCSGMAPAGGRVLVHLLAAITDLFYDSFCAYAHDEERTAPPTADLARWAGYVLPL